MSKVRNLNLLFAVFLRLSFSEVLWLRGWWAVSRSLPVYVLCKLLVKANLIGIQITVFQIPGSVLYNWWALAHPGGASGLQLPEDALEVHEAGSGSPRCLWAAPHCAPRRSQVPGPLPEAGEAGETGPCTLHRAGPTKPRGLHGSLFSFFSGNSAK